MGQVEIFCGQMLAELRAALGCWWEWKSEYRISKQIQMLEIQNPKPGSAAGKALRVHIVLRSPSLRLSVVNSARPF
jgi:hypothetical protein